MSTAAAKTKLLAGTAFAAAIAVANPSGEPATTIQLLPMGAINARDGRKWRVRDLAHAQAIVDASNATAGATDLPIDYDHQLVFGATPGVGAQAPAAGWMSNLRAQDDGVWADVAWTDAASAKLKAREYRYISPYFGFDKASGDVSRIFHAGLVNFPAITELAAVASAELDDDSMDLKALAKALGLSETATFEQIVAAATSLRTAATAAASSVSAIALAAGLAADATGEAVATAVTQAKAAGVVDPTKFAPISELAAANARIKALEDTGSEEKATAAVDQAIAGGKLTPANRDWGLGYAKADLAGFNTMIGNSPVVVSAETRSAAAAKVDPATIVLTDEEKAVCAAIGLSTEAFLKTKKEEIAHGRA